MSLTIVGNLPKDLSELLPNALRVSRYYSETAELAVAVAKAQSMAEPIQQESVATEISGFKRAVVKLLESADVERKGVNEESCALQLQELQGAYQRLKSMMLRAGAEGKIPVRQMVDHLDILSNIRRFAEQIESD